MPRSRAQRRRRSVGQLRAARRAAPRPRRGRGPRGRGPARGGSGSRAPPPCCAASGSRPVSGSKCSVSCTTRPPSSRMAIWRAISASMPRSRKRKLFMFLSSVLVPSSVAPAGRTLTLASARMEPSSMLQSLTPSRRRVARSWRRKAPAWAEVRRSGSVTISSSGVPPRLKSTDGGLGAGAAAAGAPVDELGGVLLEVGAGDAHRELAVGQQHADAARRRRSARRTGRSGTPSRGPDRSSSCGGTASAGRSRTPAPGR